MAKFPLVGYLSAGASYDHRDANAFGEAMASLGYYDKDDPASGRKANYYLGVHHWNTGTVDLKTLASVVVNTTVPAYEDRPYDVIAAGNTVLTAALQKAMKDWPNDKMIPLVFAISGDPKGAGLVKSLVNRPEKDEPKITGLGDHEDGMVQQQLDYLKELYNENHDKDESPLKRVGLLWNSDNPGKEVERKDAIKAIENLTEGVVVKLDFMLFGAGAKNVWDQARDGIKIAFTSAKLKDAQAVIALGDPITRRLMPLIQGEAIRATTPPPIIFASPESVREGALMGYGPPHTELFRRAASLVIRILHGEPAEKIWVGQPTPSVLAINTKTAERYELEGPTGTTMKFPKSILDVAISYPRP